MALVSVRLTGTDPLLMHADTTVDATHPKTKQLREYTKKRTKTDGDLETISRLEWEAGLYFDPRIGPYMPVENILRCVQEGGKVNRLGTAIKEGVFPSGTDRIPLGYEGPRDLDGLWADPQFRLVKSVKVTTTRVMRTRPRFPTGWTLEFDLDYMEDVINMNDIRTAVVEAGRRKGLGDYRPIYGRFSAEVSKA